MPQAKTLKTEVVTFTPSTGTVRDCMVWRDPTAKRPLHQQSQQPALVLPTKGGIGKPSLRNYALPGDGQLYGAPVVDDGNHVSDAMRGWPTAPTTDDDVNILLMTTPIEEEAKTRKSKKPKKPKKKKKKTDDDDEEEKDFRRMATLEDRQPDPAMGELISHKFLTEGEKLRIAQRQEELHNLDKRVIRERNKKLYSNIRPTRADQLRQMAHGPKVEHSPLELWQMPRFKANAKPKLDTFRKRVSGPRSDVTEYTGAVFTQPDDHEVDDYPRYRADDLDERGGVYEDISAGMHDDVTQEVELDL